MALTERLQPFDDQGLDFAVVFDDLTSRGWVDEEGDGTLVLAPAGLDGLERARGRVLPVNDRALAGISSGRFVEALNVMRQVIDNLGATATSPDRSTGTPTPARRRAAILRA